MSHEPLEYERPVMPEVDSRALAADLKFIGYGLLFVGGAILLGAGIIADAVRISGTGPLVAMAGAGLCILVLVLLFLGAAARK